MSSPGVASELFHDLTFTQMDIMPRTSTKRKRSCAFDHHEIIDWAGDDVPNLEFEPYKHLNFVSDYGGGRQGWSRYIADCRIRTFSALLRRCYQTDPEGGVV